MSRSRDALGGRAKLAVLVPSTNTIVQPDFDDLRQALKAAGVRGVLLVPSIGWCLFQGFFSAVVLRVLGCFC